MIRRPMTVILALVFALSIATPAHAYPQSVERWRPYLHKKLVEYGVHTDAFENRALHIMASESGGNPRAGHVYGCYGLYQFNRGWIKNSSDWRGNGRASIKRFVRCRYYGGLSAIKRHWRATYY